MNGENWTPSTLYLSTGKAFHGFSPSWQKDMCLGEVVFTTGMVGYVESLTDPSYAGQLLTFTYPLIGNYGVPSKNTWESDRIQAAGVVTAHVSEFTSHRDAKQSFVEWLKTRKAPLIAGIDWLQHQNTPLITGIDTRELTKHLRKQGVALGAIAIGDQKPTNFIDPNLEDLVSKVSIRAPQVLKRGKKRVILVDCGMKENIVRCLLKFDMELVRVPYNYDYTNGSFDGILLSNGPGDPQKCTTTIEILKRALKLKKPVFGICLGAQILALAIGGTTYKLKFGHRGHNHPCLDVDQKKCILTSQNHGYAIDWTTLPQGWRVSFQSLNDQSVEGIAHKTLPFFAVQFHPEAHPGPTDPIYLFEQFNQLVQLQ